VPPKYHIHTKTAPPRVRPAGKLGIVDWREDCAGCHNCVKKKCVYGLFRDEQDALHDEVGYLDYIYQCKGCLNCVQNCTKRILTRVVNPEYRRLGDDYYTPEIVLSTWYQAATGSIPVSGSGYGGPFSGAGFDSMWTDMSEIVRPTRDGIHGREYINTSVDIGRRPGHLAFEDGRLVTEPEPRVESPLPFLFDLLPEAWRRGPVPGCIARAALRMGLMPVVEPANLPEGVSPEEPRIVPLLESEDPVEEAAPFQARMVMVPDGPKVERARDGLKEDDPERIVAVRLRASPDCGERILSRVREGAEVIHLVFDTHGREASDAAPRHVRDVVREAHGALIREGLRDRVTLTASGGIALPEHVAKAILCGADLVGVDLAFLVALECRLCRECNTGGRCPVDMDQIDPAHGEQRVINLTGAWYHQLIEVLGAMGIREVRRLRGEKGRSMFFEDLERDTFGRLFGKRRDGGGV
jgi:ferredoxin